MNCPCCKRSLDIDKQTFLGKQVNLKGFPFLDLYLCNNCKTTFAVEIKPKDEHEKKNINND